MICPVCHTKTNQSTCPKCGLSLIKDTQPITSQSIEEVKNREEDDFDFKDFMKKQRRQRRIMYLIGLCIFILIQLIGMFNSYINEKFPQKPYGIHNTDAASSLLEDDTIITLGEQSKDELRKLYTSLSFTNKTDGLHNIYIYENSLSGLISLDAYKIYEKSDKVEYDIIIEYDLNGTYKKTVDIKGGYNGQYNQSFSYLDNNDLNALFNHLHMDNAYSKLKTASHLLTLQNDKTTLEEVNLYTGIIDGYEITIKETYLSHYNRTLYQYTITQ